MDTTRRERAEARLERRRDWAAGRQAKAAACFKVGEPYRGDWAFATQPGHISQRARVNRADERGFENLQMAEHHEQKAEGIERQLERTIFSDDDNAIEALRAKIADRRKIVEAMKAANKVVRKHKTATPEAIAALVAIGFKEARAVQLFEPDFCGRVGFPSYELTNTGAEIRRCEQRIKSIENQLARKQKAEANGGVAIEGTGEWIRVTFEEKPEREILDALRAAGFLWRGGSWGGLRAKLPEGIWPATEPEPEAQAVAVT